MAGGGPIGMAQRDASMTLLPFVLVSGCLGYLVAGRCAGTRPGALVRPALRCAVLQAGVLLALLVVTDRDGQPPDWDVALGRFPAAVALFWGVAWIMCAGIRRAGRRHSLVAWRRTRAALDMGQADDF